MKKAVLTLAVAAMVLAPGCEKIVARNEEADNLAEKVLAMFAAGEADKIYDELGAQELRKDVTREKWRGVGEKLKALGKPKEFKRTGFNQKTNNGVTTGEFQYDVTWEKAKGTFELKTKIENDKWMVLGVWYKPAG